MSLKLSPPGYRQRHRRRAATAATRYAALVHGCRSGRTRQTNIIRMCSAERSWATSGSCTPQFNPTSVGNQRPQTPLGVTIVEGDIDSRAYPIQESHDRYAKRSYAEIPTVQRGAEDTHHLLLHRCCDKEYKRERAGGTWS